MIYGLPLTGKNMVVLTEEVLFPLVAYPRIGSGQFDAIDFDYAASGNLFGKNSQLGL